MKKIVLLAVVAFFAAKGFAQTDGEIANPGAVKPKDTTNKKATGIAKTIQENFSLEKSIPATSVKDQGMTGTCWCFSSTSMIESQCMKNNFGNLDLSEMFTVRNTYLEKAKNYLLRQGHAQFGEGGLGHDLIRSIATYGIVPESEYSGLLNGQKVHNHEKLVEALKKYLDSVLHIVPLPKEWMAGYVHILDSSLGTPPEKFNYNGKQYTPKSFASEVLHFNANDYVNITSFTHHPYYLPFVIEVPDNFSSGEYYNLPLNEMIQVAKETLNKGYSVLWDADVSNNGFQQKIGSAINMYQLPGGLKTKESLITGEVQEAKVDAATRQMLYENLTTQDDHLMHIVGLEKAKSGREFFYVKNSWGDVGPLHGYINVSEGYFAMNTISIIVPKAALSKELLEKLKIK
ncbi:MAG: aminopeptidase [Bacteroidetes bacterium]|nr:aminopeptidase [Bacteroidota bacterium]